MRKNILIGNLLLLLCLNVVSQTTVNIDWNKQTELTYKRGVAAPGVGGFFDTPKMRDFLSYQSSIGMGIFNGVRNLFKDPATNEFYQENGIYKNQQIDKFTNIRKHAHAVGLEMISQVGGTPRNSGYAFDTTYRRSKSWVFVPSTDFAPIPAEGFSMQEFQRNFSEWAINADKAVADDFHSIWIGTQEVAHTIGFKDGVKNNATQQEAIRRFIDYWKPISDNLRAAGARTGGIQLNSSNIGFYNYAVDYMIQKDLHLDFLTFQFYQWGDTVDLNQAVNATKRYCAKYPGTKLIIDRGSSGKLLPDGVGSETSQGVIYILTGELGVMNHAEYVYAYALDREVDTTEQLQYKTRKWLNNAGSTRLHLSGLPTNVGGFALKTDKKLSVLIWNRSDAQTLNLKIDNKSFANGAQLTAKRVSLRDELISSAIWNAETNTVEGIYLDRFDFVKIELEFSETVGIKHVSTNNVKVYPNPAKDKIYVDCTTDIQALELITVDGKVLRKSYSTSMDLNEVKHGVYILKVELESGHSIYKNVAVD